MRRCDLDDIGAIFSQSSAYRWPCDDSAHLNHPNAGQWTKLAPCFAHRGEWHGRSCRLELLNEPWALLQLAFSLQELDQLTECGFWKSYVACLFEVFPFETCNACLLLLGIQLFKLSSGEHLNMPLNQINGVMVVSHVWAMTFKTNHIECFCSFQGAMKVEILAWCSSLI